MNRVELIGRLTKDPDLRFTTTNNTAVCQFNLAVDRKFSKNGQKEADFFTIVVWGKPAESTANYMKKGSLVGICGRLQTRSYETKDGTRKYVTEVIADEVQFLERANSTHDSSNNSKNAHSNNSHYEDDLTPVDDCDIPF